MPWMPNTQRGPVIPSTNYAEGGTPKIGIVTHVVVGSGDSAINEFSTPGMQLSAHFVIHGPGESQPDGTIIQLLDSDLCAYAQMAGNTPPTCYIAVEVAGDPSQPMTAAQCESMSQIQAWASRAHGFPLNGPVPHGRPGCTTHCNPDGTPDPAWGNHPCPGTIRLGQMGKVILRATEIASPIPHPPPPVPKEPQMHAVVTPNGDIKVYAVGAGDRAGHLLEFTRHQADQSDSVIDITAQIAGPDLFTVQP